MKTRKINELTKKNLLKILENFFVTFMLDKVNKIKTDFLSMSLYSHSFSTENYKNYYYTEIYLEDSSLSGTLIFTVIYFNNSIHSNIFYDILILENNDIENWVLHQKLLSYK